MEDREAEMEQKQRISSATRDRFSRTENENERKRRWTKNRIEHRNKYRMVNGQQTDRKRKSSEEKWWIMKNKKRPKKNRIEINSNENEIQATTTRRSLQRNEQILVECVMLCILHSNEISGDSQFGIWCCCIEITFENVRKRTVFTHHSIGLYPNLERIVRKIQFKNCNGHRLRLVVTLDHFQFFERPKFMQKLLWN